MGNEPGNVARIIWPLAAAGLIFSVAAARAQRGFAPLAFAAIAAYLVHNAMKNQKDYLSIRLFGSPDAIPF